MDLFVDLSFLRLSDLKLSYCDFVFTIRSIALRLSGIQRFLSNRNLRVCCFKVVEELRECRINTVNLSLKIRDLLSRGIPLANSVISLVSIRGNEAVHAQRTNRCAPGNCNRNVKTNRLLHNQTFVYLAKETADAISANATAARIRIGVIIHTWVAPIKLVQLNDGANQPWTRK